MGVHEFDTIRWLTGQEIVEFVGLASDVNWAPPVEGDPETVNLVVLLSEGATAVVSLARRHVPGDLCRIDILGGEAAASLTYIDPANAEAMLIEALRRQAEALGASTQGAPLRGATIADAEAALAAAEAGKEGKEALSEGAARAERGAAP
jgi:myo-inositol 2-dehydrogenase/D-chiro-inositol 1-dehydrogenase